MADNARARKLKLKPGVHGVVVNAPPGYIASLRPLPAGVTLAATLKGSFDWVQVFVTNRSDLEKIAPSAIKALNPGAILWISFPKGTSDIQTDLTRDRGWDSVRKADLKWINLVSVDETWSAFSLRPFKPGEPRESFR